MNHRKRAHLPTREFVAGHQDCPQRKEHSALGSYCVYPVGWGQCREHDSKAQFHLRVFDPMSDACAAHVQNVLSELDELIARALHLIEPPSFWESSFDIDSLELSTVRIEGARIELVFNSDQCEAFVDYPCVAFEDGRFAGFEWSA